MFGFRMSFAVPILLFSIVICGCQTTGVTTMDAKDFRETSSGSGISSAAELAPGDKIEISVEVDGRLEVTAWQAKVSNLGAVTLPLLDDVYVGGLDLNVARSVIARKYADYYVSPPVIIISRLSEKNVSEWGQVSILGRVENPGPVPLPSSSGIKLSAAIQAAGGFAPSAKSSEIQITRIDKRGRKLRVVVDFNAIGASGDADADIRLMDGDIVNVPERIW